MRPHPRGGRGLRGAAELGELRQGLEHDGVAPRERIEVGRIAASDDRDERNAAAAGLPDHEAVAPAQALVREGEPPKPVLPVRATPAL